ncbi:MAG: hypothetical protein AB7Q00_02790 [Phycisphaerales bacterium]
MGNTTRALDLLQLINYCGQIDGRKKLQKIVHILKESGAQFDYSYSFHFHGPFSTDLRNDVQSLVHDGLLEETSGPSFSGDFVQYTYKVATSGKTWLKNRGSSSQDWVNSAQSLCSMTANELEAISTLIYLIRAGIAQEDLQQKFETLKPHLKSKYDFAHEKAMEMLKTASQSPDPES